MGRRLTDTYDSRFVEQLRQDFGPRLKRSEPLARHCSLGVGGPADFFVAVASREELVRAVRAAREADVPLLVLGSGANVLPADAGFRGLVVRNVARRVDVTIRSRCVTADSGVSLPALARRLAMAGLGGLEWGTGIPGTVGGATVNNAGAYGSCVADALVSTLTIDATGSLRERPASDLAYAYRRSALKSAEGAAPRIREIVVSSTFHVAPRDRSGMLRQIREWADERVRKQPLKSDSAGSFFQNPPGDFAGRLVEAAGLKGMRVGGAQVSPMHANFLVNAGGATAADVFRLGELVRARVLECTGVLLEREVELVGDWDVLAPG